MMLLTKLAVMLLPLAAIWLVISKFDWEKNGLMTIFVLVALLVMLYMPVKQLFKDDVARLRRRKNG